MSGDARSGDARQSQGAPPGGGSYFAAPLRQDARDAGAPGGYGRDRGGSFGNRAGYEEASGRGQAGSSGAPVDDSLLTEKQIVEKAHAERQLILQRKRRMEEEARMRALQEEREAQEREAREKQRELGNRDRGREGSRDDNRPAPDQTKRPEESAWGRVPQVSHGQGMASGMGGRDWPGAGEAQGYGYERPRGPANAGGYGMPRDRDGRDGRDGYGAPDSSRSDPRDGRESYVVPPVGKVYSLAEAEGPRTETKKRELYDPVAGKLVEVSEKIERGERGAQGRGAGGRGNRAERDRRPSHDDNEEDDGRNVPARTPRVTPATLLVRPKTDGKDKKILDKPKSVWEAKIPPADAAEAVVADKAKEKEGRSGAKERRRDPAVNEEKLARQLESQNRGPRTKGFLFTFDSVTQELVQVLRPDEVPLTVPPEVSQHGGSKAKIILERKKKADEDVRPGDKKAKPRKDEPGGKKVKGAKVAEGLSTPSKVLNNMRSLGLSENLHLPNLLSEDHGLSAAVGGGAMFSLGLGDALGDDLYLQGGMGISDW